MSIHVFRVGARDSPGLPARAGLGQNAKHAAAGKRGEFRPRWAERESSVSLKVWRYRLIPYYRECSSYDWRGLSRMSRAGPSSTTQSAKN
jgi:hypothetical protein